MTDHTDTTLHDTPEATVTEYGLRGQRIVRRAAELHGMTVAQLIGPARCRPYTKARYAVMLALHRLDTTSSNIGRRVKRDHSTVLAGLKRARHLVEHDPRFAAIVDELVAAASCAPMAPAQEP